MGLGGLEVNDTTELADMPPVGLGKLAMSLQHKRNAVLHQIGLEVDGTTELAEYSTSMTTDQGTESGIAEFPLF